MKKTILVLHLTGQYPLAGVAYHTLNYVLGLIRLGYDVYCIEDSYAYPYNPQKRSVTGDCSYNVSFTKTIMEKFGLADRWVYYDQVNDVCYGLPKETLKKLYDKADVILNLYGATRLREEHFKCPVRIYMETDPVPVEIEIANGDKKALENLKSHTHHFTYGENLGNMDCPIPLPKGFDWQKTRPPVVLDLWKYVFNPSAKKFTTISTFLNDKRGIDFLGKRYYWSKHLNFLNFQDLPSHIKTEFEVALGGDIKTWDSNEWVEKLRIVIDSYNPKECDSETWKIKLISLLDSYNDSKASEAELSILRNKGWNIVDAYGKSYNLEVYVAYIYDSCGEFSVAKDLVVSTNSGWFDARSVCYLAAGKPVVLQETGFSKFITTGKGLFAFKNMKDAINAINEINNNYEYHCKEARKIAEKYFDSDIILKKMLKDCGL